MEKKCNENSVIDETVVKIDGYIDSGEPFDKAGAYAIQGGGGKFVKKIEGDRSSIIGLPMKALIEKLKCITDIDLP